MRTPLGAMIVIVIMLLLDIYVFIAIRTVSQTASSRVRTIMFSAYWIISVLAVIGFLIFIFTGPEFLPKKVRTYLFATVIGLFLAQFTAVVFFLVDDFRRLIQWGAGKLLFSNTEASQMNDAPISRSVFLSWLGLAAGSSIFGTFLYGYSNKYNYRVKRVKIAFDNLPAAFKGLKIVHFSDVHSGSFMNKKAVIRGVETIIAEKADLIVFSGDLVNDRATEMKDYMDVFNKIKAPMGVYSTFGNHDYGDYVKWPYNGIPKYGDMKKACAGTEKYPFKILISHDPSHWDAQVRPEYPQIDLTLSGHTHGMQLGVEIPGFKWSPVQYIYKEWDGLYTEGKQKLYVNPGYGFIGYPGRVGILPEITVIELG